MTHEFDRARVTRDESGSWLCLHVKNAPMARVECEQMKEGKLYCAEVKRKYDKRSVDANALYWKMCNKLSAALNEPPETIYRRHIKDIGNYETICMMSKTVGSFSRRWTSGHLGRFIETKKSTIPECTTVLAYYGSSDFSTRQMSVLIDNCMQDCKNVGVETLPENEIAAIVERWADGKVESHTGH